MRRKRETRIYWRQQGGERRAYGDFRDFHDVGGRREALVSPGESAATTDSREAEFLMARRLEELRALRQGKHVERHEPMALADLVSVHLITTKEAQEVTDDWIEATEGFLRRAVHFFGPDRQVTSIRPKDVKEFASHLKKVVTNRGMPLTQGSLRHHLNALSRLFRRGRELEAVPLGYNPVAELLEKPKKGDYDAAYLEVHDAALLLEAARLLPPPANNPDALSAEYAHALVATYLLTGGRHDEVLGLELEDVSFERRTITFRPNRWRRLKTKQSRRTVPLWPQLEAILRDYVCGTRVFRGGTLLFPSFGTGEEAMITDVRKLLDRVAARAGFLTPLIDPKTGGQRRKGSGERMWAGTPIRTRVFRHTYCSARLQTLDRGEPVSTYTVRCELGHGSDDMVNKVYSHLGEVRHRSEVVEYRVSQHLEALGDRVKGLGLALP
jgi:integrase